MTAGLAVLVFVPIVACESPPVARPAAAVPVARPDPVAREKARQVKLRGLETPNARAEYVHILAEACEYRHDPQACVEAAAVDRKLGRTLLFHGCSLGEDAACTAYVNAEVNEDKRARPLATFDAKLALEQGCAYTGGNPCVTLAKWNGAKPPPAVTSGAGTSLDRPPIHVESLSSVADLQVARDACVLSCNEELKGCTERCSKSAGNGTECVFSCSDTERACSKGCKKAAIDACRKLPGEKCNRLDAL